MVVTLDLRENLWASLWGNQEKAKSLGKIDAVVADL